LPHAETSGRNLKKDVHDIYSIRNVLFAGGSGNSYSTPSSRSRAQRLIEKLRVHRSRAWFDARCRLPIGMTLRTFGGLFPKWNLAGYDITTHSAATVRSLPGVNAFYSGSLDDIPEKFDLVTMLFVVEHLPDPRKVLEQFRRLLKPQGIAWIHTSDFWANPFDLPVVDHASHFMVDTLAELVERWLHRDHRNDN
jgi:SAM-dependent methyltransferase